MIKGEVTISSNKNNKKGFVIKNKGFQKVKKDVSVGMPSWG